MVVLVVAGNNVEFYTVKDVREILHIGKTKAYTLCKMKLFPTLKIGNKTLIYKNEFNQWLKESENSTIEM